MIHMPATGVSGLDLDVKDPFRPKSKQYHWIGFGKPEEFPENEAELVGAPDGQPHEFILYLPLYNGVEKVEIGVNVESTTLLHAQQNQSSCMELVSCMEGVLHDQACPTQLL